MANEETFDADVIKREILAALKAVWQSMTSNMNEVIDFLVDYFTEPLTDAIYKYDVESYVDAVYNSRVSNMLDRGVSMSELGFNKDFILEYVSTKDKLQTILRHSSEYLTNLLADNYTRVIIRFPKVKVTNEDNKSIEINELYVQVKVQPNGRLYGDFTMVRSEYPLIQWLSSYSHSHLPILSRTYIPRFNSPCLGGGPIGKTSDRLRDESFDIDMWGLFAFELEKYVTQESLKGGPHIRLESIGKGDMITTFLYYDNNLDVQRGGIYIYDFLKFYCHNNNIPIVFKNNQFMIGCTYLDFIISLSNSFIDWYNMEYALGHQYKTVNNLINDEILRKVIIDGNKIYSTSTTNVLNKLPDLEGKQLYFDDAEHFPMTFKGEPVRLHITGQISITSNFSLLLSNSICSWCLTQILLIVNTKYGASEQKAS